MVRVNLLNPKNLTDQHLMAEYYEILMLATYIKKHPSLEKLPEHYVLGKGHMRFFKDKVGYLKKRHERIVKEMKKRGFNPKQRFTLKGFNKKALNDWKPSKEDKKIIKKRLIQRIKLKPKFYKYYRKPRSEKFMVSLVKNSN